MSRTLSGLFLVGALHRPRKRKGTNRENPRTIPKQIGKIPEKSGKSQKGQKRAKFRKWGWRTEGVGARRSFLCSRFRRLFCTLFPIPHYDNGDTIGGTFFGCILGPAKKTLKTLISLNKEVRPFFRSDYCIWSLPSVSFLSDYSIWRFRRLFWPCDHSI